MITKIAGIKNDFLKYTLYRAYAMKTRLIILAVCGVLGFPLLSFAMIFDGNNHRTVSENTEAFVFISIGLSVLSCFIVFLMAYTGGVNCFEYFSKRENVDMSWSLPVKSRNRFWGDFCCGIVPIAVVYTLSAVIGLSFAKLGLIPDNFDDYDKMFGQFVAVIIIGLLFLISLYIIAVFSASLCGRVFEAAVYPALICGIIPALIALIGYMVFNHVWQIDIISQLTTTLTCSSPFGFLIGGISAATLPGQSPGTAGIEKIYLNPSVMIPFVLINAAFLTAAYYLSKKRKAENTGKATSFKYASEAVIALTMFCITSLFCLLIENDSYSVGGYLFGLIACTAVAFLILDVSAKRGFKKMGRAFLRYAAMVIGSVLISSLLLTMRGFGIGEYVPPLDNIESVSINLQFLDRDDLYAYSRGFINIETDFKDKDVIKLLRSLNSESNKVGGEHVYINRPVTYALKNGKKIIRYIQIPEDEQKKLLPLLLEPEYKNTVIQRLDEVFYDKHRAEDFVGMSFITRIGYKSYAGKDIQKLYDAFKQDFLAETYEQKFLSDGENIGFLEFQFFRRADTAGGLSYRSIATVNARVYIRPYYKNLKNALIEADVNPIFNQSVENVLFGVRKYDYIYAVPPEDYGYSAGYESENGYFKSGVQFVYGVKEYKNLIEQLLKVVQPYYIVDGAGYILYIDGSGYVVPPEYNYLAEELEKLAGRESPNYLEPVFNIQNMDVERY